VSVAVHEGARVAAAWARRPRRGRRARARAAPGRLYVLNL
jgi:hypothetical protein